MNSSAIDGRSMKPVEVTARRSAADVGSVSSRSTSQAAVRPRVRRCGCRPCRCRGGCRRLHRVPGRGFDLDARGSRCRQLAGRAAEVTGACRRRRGRRSSSGCPAASRAAPSSASASSQWVDVEDEHRVGHPSADVASAVASAPPGGDSSTSVVASRTPRLPAIAGAPCRRSGNTASCSPRVRSRRCRCRWRRRAAAEDADRVGFAEEVVDRGHAASPPRGSSVRCNVFASR